MPKEQSKMRYVKIGSWPVKVIIYVCDSNEGTIIPDICIEIYLFGVLVLRKNLIL